MARTKVRIEGSKKKVSDKALAALEASLGYTLPDDYRAFLLKHNGGRPEPDCFPLAGSDEATEMIDGFIPIDGANSLGLEWTMTTYAGRIPADLHPVARAGGGNIVAIGVKGRRRGKVYFWDHEGENLGEGKKPSYENVSLVAKSFDAFFGSITELDEDEDDDEEEEDE
jgi:hypothetical protein